MIGHRVHHRVRSQRQQGGFGFQTTTHLGEAGVLAVPDGHHEVGADKHHDFAGLDYLVGQVH